jgi:hypothetical protein
VQNFSWLPVNRAARVLVDILFQNGSVTSTFYHVENPIRQSNGDLVAILKHELGMVEPPLPFDAWLAKARESGEAEQLMEFFENDFERLAGGAVPLDTQAARQISPTLRRTGGMRRDTIANYVKKWRAMDFLL